MRAVVTLAALALAARALAAPPGFDATLAPATAAIGDRVTATYVTTIPEGASLELEALVTPARADDTAAPGAALEYERPSAPTRKEGPGGTVWTLVVPLTPFVSGEVSIPGPRLVYRDPGGSATPVRPPALTLTVSSRLPEGQKPDQLSPKPERSTRIPARSVWFWIGLALLVLALAALAWRLFFRKKAAAAVSGPEAPPVLPGPELLAELEKLEREAAALGPDPRTFYSRLTRAVKRYLERRTGLPILEWTTFETLRRMRDAGLDAPREAALPDLLAAADRVKFGKGSATRVEAAEQIARARLLHDAFERRADDEERRRVAAEEARAKRSGSARSPAGRRTA